MRFLYISILLVTFVTFTRAAELKIECLADYLKFRNVTDDDLESVKKNSGDPSTCTNEIRNKINEIHGTVQILIEGRSKKESYGDCAINQIRNNEKFELAKLHALFVDKKGIGFKLWKYNSHKTKIEEIEKEAQEIVDNAIIECKGQHDYGEFFNSYYSKYIGDASTSNELDFCIRDHLVKKNVIDPTLYGFKANPKNLNPMNFECESLMMQTMNNLKADVGSAANDCVKNVFYDNGYLDMILKIQLLAKMSLNPLDKETEKKHFVDSMINLTRKIKTCPLSSA